MKAHQRVIREREEQVPALDIFGRWWEGVDLTLQKTEIRKIDRPTCEAIILRYEWLGTMPPFIDSMYGIFFEGYCGGALVFSQRTESNLINTSVSIIPEDALYLSRGACTHWTPKNTASYFIARVCARLAPCTVLAYADVTAGEVGQIYQALNWYCFPSEKTDPTGYIINGVSISTRTLRSRLGTQKYSVIRDAYGLDATIIPVPRKIRYLGVYGDRRFKRGWRLKLVQHHKPYIGREAVA